MNWIAHQVAKGRGLGLALLVMLAVALPGFFSVPPIDRDEVLMCAVPMYTHFIDINHIEKVTANEEDGSDE